MAQRHPAYDVQASSVSTARTDAFCFGKARLIALFVVLHFGDLSIVNCGAGLEYRLHVRIGFTATATPKGTEDDSRP